MSKGRRIGRVPYFYPTKEVLSTHLTIWESKDLHEHIDTFPVISADTFFNNQNPILNFEIGCGTGEQIIALAKEFPNQNFIGNDISRRSIYYGAHHAHKYGLNNLHFLRADFKLIISLFSKSFINKFLMHFPDPNYGGQAKSKKKILSKNLITFFSNTLVKNGEISFITDQEIINQEFMSFINASPDFALLENNIKTERNIPKSRFQKVWETKNRNIYQNRLLKQESITSKHKTK
jgi:tRNA (guanine-N7-)-methyltransferase